MSGSKARVVSWDESSENQGGGGKPRLNFLKFKAGSTYRVRMICEPIKYLTHWKPVTCRPPFPDEKGKIIDPIVLRGLAEEAKTRFSALFFDRSDALLKVADFPVTLLEQFKIWKEAHNEPPGGKNGPDWYIKVVKKNNLTKYTATALDRAPLTQEEIAIVKSFGGSAKLQEKLQELRRPHTPEEIETMISEQGIDSGSSNEGSRDDSESVDEMQDPEDDAFVEAEPTSPPPQASAPKAPENKPAVDQSKDAFDW